jgi:hypothetical protein
LRLDQPSLSFDKVLDAIGVAGTPGSAKVMVHFEGADA